MMRRARWFLALAAASCAAVFAQPGQLNCGAVAEGSFAVGPAETYYLQADPGDAVFVRLLSTSPDRTLTPRIQFTDPAGRLLTARPGSITLGASVAGEFDLVTGGPYQIRVLAATSDGVGSYKLTYVFLNKPCGSTTTLKCNAGVRDQFSSELETKTYQFPAEAGDILSARFFRVDGNIAPVAAVYSSGKLLMNGNQAIVGQIPSSGTARVEFPVNQSGTLTIVLFDSGRRTGNYGLVVTRLNRPCGTTAISCGGITQSALANAFDIHSYSVAINAGDIVSFRTTALTSGLVPFLEAYDPNGTAVPLSPAVLNPGGSVLTYYLKAPVNGPYTLLLRDNSSRGMATGTYAISMVRFNRPCTSLSLSCSSLTEGAVSGTLGISQYTLEVSAGDVYQFRLLRTDQGSLFRPGLDVFDPQGVEVQSLAFTGGRAIFTAPGAGTYIVVVSDSFDNSQSGTYLLSSLRLNRPCAAGALSCGGAVTGSLARALATAVYTYTADPGDAFTLRMIDNSGSLQPSLEIYDSQGNPAGQPVGGNYTAADVVSPSGGVYTIIASDASQRPVGGNFSVALLRTRNTCGASPPQGEAVNGVVNGKAPFVSYSIPANAGDTLAVRSAAFTSGFSALMELYDPNGSRLDAQTYAVTRKVPATGNYTLIVGASAPRTAGAYALAWQLLNSPAGAAPLECGGTASAALTPAKEFRYYTAAVAGGDLIRLIFTKTSDNFSPQIELFDPTGARLAANADISVKAAMDGNYLVLVGPSSSIGETGSYSVAFQRPNRPCGAASLTCGQSTLRQVNLPGQLDTVTFNGTGGEQADIRAAVRTGNYAPFLELYDASGTRVGTSSTGALQPTLPSTGGYTLLVRDRGGLSLGSYRVSLQNATKACPLNDAEPPSITLVQPTGGDVIAGGSPFRIQWLSDDNTGLASHDIAFSADGGKTFSASIASGLSGNQQSYTWSVPPDIAPSRIAVIRISATDAAGNTQAAVSGPLSVIGAGFTPNNTVSYTYDALNRLTSAVLQDGRVVRYAWDDAGNLIQVTVSGQ
jgi:YD repeat-containing protein